MLSVGQVVDDFEAVDHNGQRVTLGELIATGPLVLFFYIKAKTPG
jgi:peroxiredoxin